MHVPSWFLDFLGLLAANMIEEWLFPLMRLSALFFPAIAPSLIDHFLEPRAVYELPNLTMAASSPALLSGSLDCSFEGPTPTQAPHIGWTSVALGFR